MTHLTRKIFPAIGLADQIHAWIKPAAMDHRILGVARRERYLNEGVHLTGKPYRREALAQKIRYLLWNRPQGTPAESKYK